MATHQQLVEIMDKIRSLASIDHCVDADEDIQKVFREYGVGVPKRTLQGSTRASSPLIKLFKEFKETRKQYAKVGANDGEINESIMELMKQAIGFFDDDDEIEHVENTTEYWLDCLYVYTPETQTQLIKATEALQAVAQKIIDCVAGLKMGADELEELYDDYL